MIRNKDSIWLESWIEALRHHCEGTGAVRLLVLLGFELGVRQGWWEDWNVDAPIPFPKKFSIAELGPTATTANIVVALGIFPSITQARKNGFNAPLEVGMVEFTKRKIRAEIVA